MARKRKQTRRDEAHNRENPTPESAAAENAERGRGEFAEQREATAQQYRLGYPQNRGPRPTVPTRSR